MTLVKDGRKRDSAETRRQILDTAFIQIYRKGFQGISIDDIVKETPFTKGALYHLFPTKLDLGYAVLEEIIQPLIFDRWIKPIEEFENPIDGILHQLDVLIGQARVKDLTLGCPLNNLVQEMSPIDEGFKSRLKVTLESWIEGLAIQLLRGQNSGFIKNSVDVEDAAYFIVMAHEGFYGTMKGLSSKKTYHSLLNSLKIYLNAIEA